MKALLGSTWWQSDAAHLLFSVGHPIHAERDVLLLVIHWLRLLWLIQLLRLETAWQFVRQAVLVTAA